VLIDGRNLWKLHGRWLAVMVVGTLAAVAWTWLASRQTGRWPGGGSMTGLALGSLAALIFLFELALVAKKTKPFRTARWMLSAQTWMKAHIWLGLFTVPLVILHSGGRLGGTLSMLLVAVFSIVIASGVWGLVLQNVLPRLLLDAAPAETVYSQIDSVGRQYAVEARRLVMLACGGEDPTIKVAASADSATMTRPGGDAIHGARRHVGLQIERSPNPAGQMARPIPSPAIETALARDIRPFLERGAVDNAPLGSRQRQEWYFEDLRLRVAPELRTLVGQLEELCERRRQLDIQRRIHFWLHNWLWLHLPLSVGLMILLAAHIVFALRFG
jgi:hypothetical protein